MIVENLYFTKLNANLFLFLEKSLPNRTSRFEAFLELYKAKTVMSFLKSLQEMGVLEYKRCGYNMEVRIINLAYFPIEKRPK